MKNKFSLFLLSFMILFCVSIDVNAATEITVDTSKCLDSDPGSCLISNNQYVREANTTSNMTIKYDFFKTIDYYYNKDTNVITYKFTELFESFLESTKDTEYDYSKLTIEEYMTITGATKEEMESGSTQLVNDLDKLYSLFAVYVRRLGYSPASSATYCVGTYLLLRYNPYDEISAVTVANLQFETDENGEWVLNPLYIVPKTSPVGFVNLYVNSIENSFGTEGFNNISSKVGEIIKFYAVLNMPKYPINSINKTFWSSYTLPAGMDYAKGVSSFNIEAVGQNFSNNGNGQVIDSDTGEVVANLILDGKNIKVEYVLDNILVDTITTMAEVKLNTNAVVGATGNIVNAHFEYAVDPYSEDGIEIMDSANMFKIYTYGLKINITDKDDITKFLPGAVFELYDANDTEFKNVLTTITIGEDGRANVVGIAAGSYILKQIKTSSGYHMNENYAFTIASDDLDEDGYFVLNLTSQKYSLLPFTGGAGTLTYTLWGLALIIVAALGLILYRKKNQQIEEVETL